MCKHRLPQTPSVATHMRVLLAAFTVGHAASLVGLENHICLNGMCEEPISTVPASHPGGRGCTLSQGSDERLPPVLHCLPVLPSPTPPLPPSPPPSEPPAMPDYSCSLHPDGEHRVCTQIENIGSVYGSVLDSRGHSVPTAAMLTECAQMIHSYIAGANTENCILEPLADVATAFGNRQHLGTACWNAASIHDGTCWCYCWKAACVGINTVLPPTSGSGVIFNVYECTT